MAFILNSDPITKIGIIGSGQIGPDIALYFTKVLHKSAIPVVVVDISEEALTSGKNKLKKKIDKGIETGAFSTTMGQAMKDSCTFTSDYESLRGADFIVEAATENRDIKAKIFLQLEGFCPSHALLASNSSHLEPEAIFKHIKDRSRTLVIHYFFPAERNPIVEVVPGKDTDPKIADSVMHFYEAIGKVPIKVGSRFGYAVDPIFEGLFHAAARLVEAGAGSIKEVDAIAARTLGLTVGPFTAMNLTNGNPITFPALSVYAEKVMPWYRPTRLMADAMQSGQAWDVPKRGEKITVEPKQEQRIANAMRGAYFGLCTEILNSGITNIADFEMALGIALDVLPPFTMMNKIGIPESLALVERYAAEFDGFRIADILRQQSADGKPWTIPYVIREDQGDVAVIKIRRPKVLNALNNETFQQIENHCKEIEDDDRLKGAVLTAFGAKAFVSGADVNFLADINSAEMGEETSLSSQRSLNVVEDMSKPVVCAMNGFAFGGGNELAMACVARIARKGLPILASQPEPTLGIIPGAGGTQRLPRWIGIEKAAEMLRTGKAISSAEGLELGLISKEVEGDLVTEAVDMVRAAASGEAPLTGINRAPLDTPDDLGNIDLGHLSRAVDKIICRAIIEGCRKELREGLAFEAKMFGQVCATKDMKIGIKNFLENGPRAPAKFIHE